MSKKVEVFSAGCNACDSLVQLVQEIASSDCEVSVLDMQDQSIAERAKTLGIKTIPAVAINGILATCCSNGGYNEATLRSLGLGVSI